MTLKQLEYFAAIVRSGSMAAAAKELHVSQSALSQTCSMLEKEFGTALFTKNGRGLTLTEKGTYFYEKGKELLRMADALSREMISMGENQMRIPFYTDVVDNSDEIMLLYSNFFPDVILTRMFCSEKEAVECVKQDSLVFLLTLREMTEAGIRSECLIDEPVVALVREDFPLVGRKGIWLRELDGESFISFQNSPSLDNLFREFCSQARIKPKQIVPVHAPYLQVKQGRGILLMPMSTYNCLNDESFLQGMVGLPVLDHFCRRRVFLSWAPSGEKSSCRQGVFDFLRLYHDLAVHQCCLPQAADFEVAGPYQLKLSNERKDWR